MTEGVRKRVPITLRTKVWDRYIGLDKGSWKCFCGKTIYQIDFEAGHVVVVSKGGTTTIENLRPVCSMCNKSMGSENLFDFIASIGVLNPYIDATKRGEKANSTEKIGDRASEISIHPVVQDPDLAMRIPNIKRRERGSGIPRSPYPRTLRPVKWTDVALDARIDATLTEKRELCTAMRALVHDETEHDATKDAVSTELATMRVRFDEINCDLASLQSLKNRRAKRRGKPGTE